MDKWVIHEPTVKTPKCDSDEPRTSANRHLTSEMFLSPPQQRALQQNQLLSVANVTGGKFSRGNLRKYHEAHLNMDLIIPLLMERSAQYLICCKILANVRMKPIKLVRLIVRKHMEFKNKPTHFS
jgi:hypothetical protein